MKRKFLSVLLALVLVLSFSLVIATPAGAQTTWYVDGTLGTDNATQGTGPGADAFKTIQYAIDDTRVGTGDTINVAAGTYTEDLVIPATKSNLELKPATGATVKIKGVDTLAWANWPLADPNIDILASGVKIHGFTLESPNVPATDYSSGMVIDGTNVEIYDNSFVSTGTGGAGCVAIQTYRDNVLGYNSDISGLNIHDNSFSGTLSGGYVGVFINHTLTGTGTVTVQDNTFSDTPYQGVVTERDNTVISGNSIITDMTATGYGIMVMDWDARAQDNVQVTGNTIKGSTASYGFAYGMLIGRTTPSLQTLTNISVTGNTVQTNDVGIKVRASANGVVVNYNDISGNTVYGVENTDTSNTLDATDNWWDSAVGPTHSGNVVFNASTARGDDVSDYVDYVPWYDTDKTGSSFAPVTVGTGTTYHTSIQAGINAASAGDTITAATGTFTEDLTVNTANLTLKSVAGSTTIQLVSGVGIDIQGGADNFKLGGASGQGFTISPHATATTFDIQLANAPSGVEISYNTIDTTGTASMGVSVGAAGATGLAISNNTFTADTGDGSIWGPNVVNVTVSNNTLSGGSYGIQFSGVTGTSTISNNTISSFTGSGGIVISNGAGTSGLTITGNTISSSSNGIYFVQYTAQGTPADMTTVTVTYNTISGSTNDAIKIGDGTNVKASNFTIMYNAFINSTTYGLENTHTSEQVTAEWNWWDAATGPDDDGNKNPYYVEAAAASADKVDLNVDFTPWMIHTSLASGWNIYSTPITSGTSTDTISEALDFWGSDASLVTAAYYYDSSSQAWAVATSLTPQVPVYLNLSGAAAIDVLMSTSNTAPPAMTMYQGWNLVGPAQLYNMEVDDALISAFWGTGAANLVGYSQAVSPGINQTATWTYIRGDSATGVNFIPTEGFWVYMVNQGTLGGFTYTPITLLP